MMMMMMKVSAMDRHRESIPIPVTQSGQQFGLQAGKKFTHECVCVQKDTFAVLGQCPAVDFGKGDAKLRTSQQGQVHIVSAVHQVDLDDLVKHVIEGDPGERQQQVKLNPCVIFSFVRLEKSKEVTHLDCLEMFGVTKTTKLRVVPWCLKLLATTMAPMQ